MTLKTTVHNTVDYLTNIKDIELYLEAWFELSSDDLITLQLILENSVKAVIKLRQEQGA
jgi:hypothetical protein